MNENNQETPGQTQNVAEQSTPETTQIAPQHPEAKKPSSKKLLLSVIIAGLIAAGLSAYFLMSKEDDKLSLQPLTEQQAAQVEEQIEAKAAEVEAAIECGDKKSGFADKAVGFAFCYPSEWGEASVIDAKVDNADTGHREAVRFSANTLFIAGGVSEDWSTTVGRDTGCQEPNNTVPELSSYNTEWHDVIGSGMAVEFAIRSLESSEGGYDMTETVSNLLESGVCVQGHKTIRGSRYKVAFAGYYENFSESSGITSPKAHMDNPNILFTTTQRTQYDALLASLVKYE